MSDTSDDLRTTSEALSSDLHEMDGLEREKRASLDDPDRLERAARRADAVARRIARASAAQHDLSEELVDEERQARPN